jgi:crotonobetainyl-CoA:carnitine CoA-transferase CaiB-like acyl-CoA transferase
VAVTVDDDAGWAGFAALLGSAALDARYATLAGRIEHHDVLDALIAGWTSTRSSTEAAEQLQAAGIAACEVLDNLGVLHDPQIAARRWFELIESKRFPDGDLFSGHPIRLAGTPGAWWRAGPSMGQDTVDVLTERAGMSPAAVDALIAAGAAFLDASPELKLRRPYIDDAAVLDALGVARAVAAGAGV